MKSAKSDNTNKSSYEAVIYKLIVAFALALAAIFAVLMVNSRYSIASQFMAVRQGLLYASIVFGAIFLLGLVMSIATLKSEGPLRWISRFLLAAAFVCGLSCLAMYLFSQTAVTFLCALYPTAAVYYLVYLIYPREFLSIATADGAAILALFFLSKSSVLNSPPLFAAVLAFGVVLPALILAVSFYMSKNKGLLRLGGFSLMSYSLKAGYPLIYANCALGLLCVALSAFAGAMAAYYSVFIVAALLFVSAVYYTIKLG